MPAGPLPVRRWDTVEVCIRYVMGCGYGSLGLTVSPASVEPHPDPSRTEAAMT